jgi:OOP family OmpA-OmpF porin
VQPAQPKSKAPIASIPPPPKAFEKVTLSAKELFGFDKWQLEGSVPRLDEIAKALKDNPGITGVTISGYTDRLGTDEYNMALSKRRAESVRFYLMRQGVDGKRLEVSARGEANPIVTCHDKDLDALIKCLEPNRRIEIEPFTIEKKMDPASRTG